MKLTKFNCFFREYKVVSTLGTHKGYVTFHTMQYNCDEASCSLRYKHCYLVTWTQ